MLYRNPQFQIFGGTNHGLESGADVPVTNPYQSIFVSRRHTIYPENGSKFAAPKNNWEGVVPTSIWIDYYTSLS
jgi:hypothetical protein